MVSTSRINEAGATEWRENGELHREDGPAYEWPDGGYQWSYRGQVHRIGGPAIYYASGYQAWFVHGKQHREDGPAVTTSDGTKQWWINGTELTEEEFTDWQQQRLIATAQELCSKGLTKPISTLPKLKIQKPSKAAP